MRWSSVRSGRRSSGGVRSAASTAWLRELVMMQPRVPRRLGAGAPVHAAARTLENRPADALPSADGAGKALLLVLAEGSGTARPARGSPPVARARWEDRGLGYGQGAAWGGSGARGLQ